MTSETLATTPTLPATTPSLTTGSRPAALRFNRWDWSLLLSLTLACQIIFTAADAATDWDDAYISYRYARNLAAGHGLVYNPGERIYGSTTLLWVGWLALWSRLTGAEVEAVSAASARVFMPAAVALVYLLARRLGRSRLIGLAAAALTLAAPQFSLIAAFGMETMLYDTLIVASFLLALCNRPLLAGVAAGLTLATRPDGLAVIAALGAVTFVCELLDLRRSPPAARDSSEAPLQPDSTPTPDGPNGLTGRPRLRALLTSPTARLALGFLLIAIPFESFCFTYYGAFLPHTLGAKRLHPMYAGRWWMPLHFLTGPAWPVTVALLLSIAIALIAFFRRRSTRLDAPAALGSLGGTGIPPVSPSSPSSLRRSVASSLILSLPLSLLLYFSAWTAARIDSYPWYIAAMGPLCALVVILPLVLLREIAAPRSLQALAAVGLHAVYIGWTVHAVHEVHRVHIYEQQIEIPRKQVALQMHARAADRPYLVRAGAIGILGYFWPECRIVDGAGLVSDRDTLKRDLNRVDFFFNGLTSNREWAREFTCIGMWSAPFPAGPDTIMLARRENRVIVDGALPPPAIPLAAQFGDSITLLGATPVRTRLHSSDVLQFEAVWQFIQPPGPDFIITYSVADAAGNVIAVHPTHGLYRDVRTYTDVVPGERVRDFLNFVHNDLTPGQYQVLASIEPNGLFPLKPNFGGSALPGNCVLLEFEVRR